MKLNKLFVVVLVLLSFVNLSLAQEGESKKRFNVHTNPLTWIVGLYSIGADVAITDNVTLGGSYNIFDFSGDEFEENIDASANGLGFRAQYFFNQAFTDSWYLTGFFDSTKGEVDDTSTNQFADFRVNSTGVTAGYFWIWNNFNIQLGLGFQQNNVKVTDSTLSAQDRADLEDLDGASITGDFRIGLAF
jgi:hypothetical protein